MRPRIDDPDFRLYVGSALDVLRQLEAESVHCVVTSPPYWALRDYGTATWEGGAPECDHVRPTAPPGAGLEGGTATQEAAGNFYAQICGRCGAERIDQQLGLEATPQGYVDRLVEIFREVRRVLRRDGVCWLNLGDTYANTGGGDISKVGGFTGEGIRATLADGRKHGTWQDSRERAIPQGLKAKDLVGIPWRVAFALQADGWWLRSDVIWSKPNPMPESITDRPTRSHEYVFMLTRSRRYFFDPEAVREDVKPGNVGAVSVVERSGGTAFDDNGKPVGAIRTYDEIKGANVRSVWTISTQPYRGAHFATFPQELVARCIEAGTSERGCCPACGAPWSRVVERVGYPDPEPQGDDLEPLRRTNNDADRRRALSGKLYARFKSENPDVDGGWVASCDHDLEPIGCVVLDPFLGSGTTAYVARAHGRRCVGIELNPEYADLIATRTQQLSLLAKEVPA